MWTYLVFNKTQVRLLSVAYALLQHKLMLVVTLFTPKYISHGRFSLYFTVTIILDTYREVFFLHFTVISQ